ncbi:MAG: DUF2628 domain-containing protein [Gammaproteobacteria bacterium]|nr:DUF2628 domain-containing protein [Gammaproteobacteria bacterium]
MHPLLRPGVTQENLKAFIGNNADKIIRRGSRDISWCWPALFVPSLWLAYRKAYAAAVVVFLVQIALSTLSLLLDTKFPEFIIPLGLLITAVTQILLALFAMRYYLNFASKKVAKINAETADMTSREVLYRVKGGTSAIALVVFMILTSIVGMINMNLSMKRLQNSGAIPTVIITQSNDGQTATVTLHNATTTVQSEIIQTDS